MNIEERIGQLQSEQQLLKQQHDVMVADFQKNVAINQSRYAQLEGAIAELTRLRKEQTNEHTTECSGNRKPGPFTDWLPHPDHRSGDHMGSIVGNRKLDPPYTSTSKISVGDNPPDPGDPMGTPKLHGN